MAGSWGHMVTDDGRLRNNESFHDLLENGGDVYEAAEECFGMVWWLANEAASGAGVREEDRAAFRQSIVEQARQHYKTGLELGGVQPD
jgi:hypothetical protein